MINATTMGQCRYIEDFGVAPSVLTIKDAIPVQEYTREIFVFNTSSADHIYPIAGSGDIKSWVTFHDMEDQRKAITQLPVPDNISFAGDSRKELEPPSLTLNLLEN